uniref:Uncharacterized protein n=1 Tax=Anopheles atroparvus TaxID=41427 RepID=A0AAG5D590_ANOAO
EEQLDTYVLVRHFLPHPSAIFDCCHQLLTNICGRYFTIISFDHISQPTTPSGHQDPANFQSLFSVPPPHRRFHFVLCLRKN